MKLSTKGKYAVSAMMVLARNFTQEEIYLSLNDIAQESNLSMPYLEQLFSKLKKSGLLISTKGSKGGYRISRAPSAIFISEIIAAVDDDIDSLTCKSSGRHTCTNDLCRQNCLWTHLVNHIEKYLGSLSLAHVLENKFEV